MISTNLVILIVKVLLVLLLCALLILQNPSTIQESKNENSDLSNNTNSETSKSSSGVDKGGNVKSGDNKQIITYGIKSEGLSNFVGEFYKCISKSDPNCSPKKELYIKILELEISGDQASGIKKMLDSLTLNINDSSKIPRINYVIKQQETKQDFYIKFDYDEKHYFETIKKGLEKSIIDHIKKNNNFKKDGGKYLFGNNTIEFKFENEILILTGKVGKYNNKKNKNQITTCLNSKKIPLDFNEITKIE